ncbi:cytochrome-c oxidase, cbb3-type subunit II [Candidatus Bandiella numerosa]|jgi:cytochrome c oxidase cbb3-type subunit 2|uniref:cytochrome-c oxidase, cbb3-type subunit II n=1 Tax=Candidatus Bandiella numerosa TaxID=2570586 RepID=UPI00249E1332|nr:cytochrome-c oxidase, cbb3-type subunit II [Candidatus Bandiella numerosa]WHA05232.1 cytochrome-c oxidase, cbb3-type subunit II [Candidatus Bandiella numerosa]
MSAFHSKIERNIFILLVLTIVVTSIGAIIQIFPLFKKEIALEKTEELRLYTPLELQGFFIYKREGCYGCHSQQIRKLTDEVERYGHYSLAVESMYDYPFAWGSKRTGPDLARVGEKYSDDWHVEHLDNPRSLVPESIMPAYSFMLKRELKIDDIPNKMSALKLSGMPYTKDYIENYENDISVQLGINQDSNAIVAFRKRYGEKVAIRKFNRKVDHITEMDALVAYLQGLGNKIDLSSNQGRNW